MRPASQRQPLSVLDGADVLELDGDESVRLVHELDVLRIAGHLGGKRYLDARVGANLLILHRRLADLRALDGHVLGDMLLLEGALDGVPQHRLVLKRLVHDVPGRQVLIFLDALHDRGLRRGKRHRGDGAVLLGRLLDDARDGVDDLFARDALGALEQPLGDEHAALARNGALLVLIEDLEGAGAHERERGDLLGRTRQDGIVAGDAARRALLPVFHLMHERHAALKQQHRKPARVVIVVEIGHEDVCGLELVGTGKLPRKELRDVEREVEEVPLSEEIALELGCKGALVCKRAAAVVPRAARLCQVLGHKRANGARVELELSLREHVHPGVEVQDVQNGMVDIHRGRALPVVC